MLWMPTWTILLHAWSSTLFCFLSRNMDLHIGLLLHKEQKDFICVRCLSLKLMKRWSAFWLQKILNRLYIPNPKRDLGLTFSASVHLKISLPRIHLAHWGAYISCAATVNSASLQKTWEKLSALGRYPLSGKTSDWARSLEKLREVVGMKHSLCLGFEEFGEIGIQGKKLSFGHKSLNQTFGHG